MHDLPLLRDLVILVAVAIPVVVLAQRFRLPTIVGFLLTGIAIGPNGLALIHNPESVSTLAEMGVVLLLFTIGLELSLSRVIRMGRWVLQGGALQVGVTMLVVTAVTMLAGARLNLAIFVGALVALSSTAIILKLYTDRGELDTTHGRVVVAVLIFQDLCVVPMMLLVPILAGASEGALQAVRTILVSVVIVGILVFGGRRAVPWALERIAALRNREIFTLSVVLVGVGAAWITSLAGLSLALGAFLAGLVLSESDYGMQALSDVLPFRDTFSGIFFTSVGMLLDPAALAERPFLVVEVTLAVIVIKTAVVIGVVKSLKRSFRVAMIGGLGLAQVGEFSFVLASTGLALGLLVPWQYQLFLGASVLTMLLTPFMVGVAEPLSERAARLLGPPAVMIPTQEMRTVDALVDHVIIVGWGLTGRNLASALDKMGIRYVVLETNGQAVRRARLARQPVFFGDGTRAEVLEKVGIHRARVVVFAIASAGEERRGTAVARSLNKDARIVVRTRYVREIEELTRLGADEIVPEELETSVEIFARVLRRYGVPNGRIRRLIEEARADQYEIFRAGEKPGRRLSDALTPLGGGVLVDTVIVEENAPAVGETVQSLGLRAETGATLVAVIRGDAARFSPGPDEQFAVGDEVMLVGSRDALERATAMFQLSPRMQDTATFTAEMERHPHV
jgi:CPA2 family monovalent cation:H+ antiporter-2